MSSVMDLLAQSLGGDAVRQMSQAIGADEGSTRSALGAALPMLVTALARNASTPDGASALHSALDRGGHDGSLLDNLGGFLQSFQASQGDSILGHVLGTKRPGVEAGLSRASGLDPAAMAKLLAMVAPLVLGALAKTKQSQGLDASALGRSLGTEQSRIQASSPAGGLLGSLLDQDGDGQVADDIARMGMGMLGKFLGGKR